MSLFPIAGQRIYIGGVLADKSTDFIASDFSAQVWVEIDGWSKMGSLDDSAATITTPLINRGRDQKQKGTASAPDMQNEFVVVQGDAGQTALIAAAQPSVKDNYAFKILGNESGTPSQRLFIGLVTSAAEPGGDANTIRMLNGTIAVNSNIVKVAAS